LQNGWTERAQIAAMIPAGEDSVNFTVAMSHAFTVHLYGDAFPSVTPELLQLLNSFFCNS
jgi:hypothetical protein